MKILAAAFILLLGAFSHVAPAQVPGSWVKVSPTNERFTVLMPHDTTALMQENSLAQISFKGRSYAVSSDGVEYTVWALKYPSMENYSLPEGESYLDAFADLVWESLLKPQRDQFPDSSGLNSYMHYRQEFSANGLYGREYSLLVGKQAGLVHIISEAEVKELYVLTVLNADANSGDSQRFVNSFSFVAPKSAAQKEEQPNVAPTKPAPSQSDAGSMAEPGVGGGVGVGSGSGMGIGEGLGPSGDMRVGDPAVGGRPVPSGGATVPINYNRIFNGRDVTQKARILSRPTPGYTTSARKYDVQGSVVMRAVFSRSGEVTDIRVVKALPHGLTAKAIESAKLIKFVPAVKDGHVVSQYMQLEVNFHLY